MLKIIKDKLPFKFKAKPPKNFPLTLNYSMKIKRYALGIDKTDKILSIGEEFKKEINQENPNRIRALEILGKFNPITLQNILYYNQISKMI
jgi:hypothetical protein